jgi:nitroreductase
MPFMLIVQAANLRLFRPVLNNFGDRQTILMRYNLSEIKALLSDRRTIYPENFSKRKVSKEIIHELLDHAKWAPTHRYTQPWRFTVFADNGIAKLSEWQSNTYRELEGDSFSQEKFERLRDRPLLASAIIAVSMRRDPEERDPEQEEIASVAMAVQNMMLLAAAHGIGIYWSTGGLTYSEEIKTFIGLAEDDRFMGLLYVGYPEGEWPKKTRRRPMEYYTTWVD